MFRKELAPLTRAILLLLGLIFSAILIAVIAALGLAAWCYLWWKTRKLPQSIHEQTPDDQVIDGEAIIVEEYGVETNNLLPGDPSRQ
jgi:hypothetical protein